MSKLSKEEARDKVFNDYLDNITKSVRKARTFYKTTVAELETELENTIEISDAKTKGMNRVRGLLNWLFEKGDDGVLKYIKVDGDTWLIPEAIGLAIASYLAGEDAESQTE